MINYCARARTREKFIRLRIRYNSACYSRKDRNAIASILQTKFKGKTGIRIGGRLSPEYTTYLSLCEKVIDANIILPGGSAPEEVDYIAEATNLHFAGDGQYDFVCSAHVLEHVANPVKALYEWKRVIKDDGFIYAAIPDKRFTFDNRRKRTTLSHLIQDYNMDVDQNDITHVAELIDKWDQRLDMIFCHSRETWL
ncbi:MAG: methyltransferase domain-containing protein, partial [Candidatus Omnitrophica bacterium]|nr:methyltransferase domain-containing protein [Candidatus Omnitrophota bacterium]